MDCHIIQDLLEEYALEMLDAETEATVAAHLGNCPQCQMQLDEYHAIVAALPEALVAMEPRPVPATIKTQLLQKIEGELDRPTHAAASVQRVSPIAATVRWAQLLRANGRLPRWALVAASILLFLALAWSVRLNVALAREQALRSALSQLVEQQEIVLEVVDSPQAIRRFLRATTEESRAYGKVFSRADMVHVVAMGARLAPPPKGQAYHLWLTEAEQTELAGVMTVNDDGFGLLIFDADEINPDYTTAILTLQPIGIALPADATILRWEKSE